MAMSDAMDSGDTARLGELLDLKPDELTTFDNYYYTLPGNDTILHEAIGGGASLEVVRYLVDRGADPNAYNENTGGDTPLDKALRHGASEIIEYLLGQGANPNIPTWMWITATGRANKRLAEPECTDEAERVALRAVMEAAKRFPPPSYPDGTVPEHWPPTPDNPHPKRVQPEA